MRIKTFKILAVSALALSASAFSMDVKAAPLLSNDIIVAQSAADPGSRPGDVPGTTTPIPGPAGSYAPRVTEGPGASGVGGDRAGDTPGSIQPVAPSVTKRDDGTGPAADSGNRAGDAPGTSSTLPPKATSSSSVGVPSQCAGETNIAERQACIDRNGLKIAK